MDISKFTENDFISAFIFGGGGVFLFYLLPLVIFVHYYLQFRNANTDITIEGFTARYVFYSFAIIVAGGFIFTLLSAFSFSSVSNASKGLAYFFCTDFDKFNTMFTELKNNTNLLDSEKNIIQYEILLLGTMKILFKTLSLIPVVLTSYLLFVNLFKCIKKSEMGESFNVCYIKKAFFLLLFLIEIYIVFVFADRMVIYLIKHYTNINIDNYNIGIVDILKASFKTMKTLIVGGIINN